jgi:hypothetical protein
MIWGGEIYGSTVRHRTWLLWAVLLVASGCSGEGGGVATSAAVTSIGPPTTTNTMPTTTTGALPTTTSSAPTTTAQRIDVYFEGGQVVGQDQFSYALGEQVSVWVLSDDDDEVHVHGYDLFFTVTAGVPLEISVTAEIPGIFEVELESTHTLLFELVVAP